MNLSRQSCDAIPLPTFDIDLRNRVAIRDDDDGDTNVDRPYFIEGDRSLMNNDGDGSQIFESVLLSTYIADDSFLF